MRIRNHTETKWRATVRRMILGVNVAAPAAALGLWLAGHGWLALLSLLGAHALLLIPTLVPRCGWCGPVVSHLGQTGADAGNVVWLTIDDGPHPQDTPLLLDLLEAHQARATFFFIGARAQQYPELVREVLRRGHDLGNHTMNHPQYSFWAYPPAALRREIAGCQQALSDAGGGYQARWFRAPAGLKNPFIHPILEQQGLRLACWNARGLDGVERDPEKILARLKPGIRAGAVILLHEAREDGEGNRLAPLVLKRVLQQLKEQGLLTVIPARE